jgi:hypothetical protein
MKKKAIAPKHNSKYYFESGDVIFLVSYNAKHDNNFIFDWLLNIYHSLHTYPPKVARSLFRVHRHFFVRESVVFRDMLSIPSGSETTIGGLSDDNPIVPQGVKRVDFENILWMFYNELSFF